MIDSMTGFGRGQAEVGNVAVTVELRSVNNRCCEVSTRLPRRLSEYEAEVQARIKKAFSRGRSTVQVQLDESAEASLPIATDEDAVRAYTGLLNRLRAVAGISEPIRLEQLLQYSDIF